MTTPLSLSALAADITTPPPASNQLDQLLDLAARSRALDAEAEQLEQRAKALRNDARELTERRMPDLMTELGLQSFQLADGTLVTLKQVITASLSKANKAAGLAWLRAHNHSELIKTEVTVAFGRGEEKDAQAFTDNLREHDMEFILDEGVHPQTLGAFVRELIATGQPVPTDTLGVFILKRAEFKAPKSHG